MHTLTVRRSTAPIALAAILLAAFALFFAWPQSASAHDSLVSSDPAADSTVETLPSELTLTFSAALIDGEGATEIVVTDADCDVAAGAECEDYTDGEPTLDGAMVTQPLVSAAPAGEYRVIWKVVSSDGHPTSEEFGFTVSTGTEDESATPEPAESATAAPTESATAAPVSPDDTTADSAESDESTGSAWIWVISIVGILAVIGVVTWLAIRGRRGPQRTDSDNPAEG